MANLVISLPGPVPPEVVDMKVAESGNIWLVLSNGLLLQYHLKLHNIFQGDKRPLFDYYFKLKLRKDFGAKEQLRGVNGWNGRFIILKGQN
jgi:hypothetical protein